MGTSKYFCGTFVRIEHSNHRRTTGASQNTAEFSKRTHNSLPKNDESSNQTELGGGHVSGLSGFVTWIIDVVAAGGPSAVVWICFLGAVSWSRWMNHNVSAPSGIYGLAPMPWNMRPISSALEACQWMPPLHSLSSRYWAIYSLWGFNAMPWRAH
jgi:hypothetical protein